MKLKLFTFTLLSGISSVYAQSTYHGRVTEAASSNAVPNTEVKLLHLADSSEIFRITDNDGRFEFKNVKDGNYLVSVFHLSYSSVVVSRKMPYNGTDYFTLELLPELLEEAVVSGTRARDRTPATFQNISKKELGDKNFGQDMPLLIGQTPSTVVTSDAGAGVGYTGIRLRGIDATRINVTINGFPYNDAESQGVYWVNLPDLASSVNSIQIQRGVGTSTNGSAAFGGSINIKTDHVNENAFSRVDLGYGSFNTVRRSFQFGTGMLGNGWGFQGRYSVIQSDGYIDRASSDLNSLYLTGVYRTGKNQFKFNVIRGHERTYQAWWGVPQTYFEEGNSNPEFIQGWAPSAAVAENMMNSDPKKFNYYTYKNQVDNYNQDHYQGFYTRQLKAGTFLNVGVNYTRGLGYYEEYHDDENWFDDTNLNSYGMNYLIHGGDSSGNFADTITHSDVIRRLWLDNHFIGTIFNLSHRTGKLHAVLGGGLHNYRGLHYGDVVWARYASNSEIDHRFYKNHAQKRLGNIYLKLDNEPMLGRWTYLIDLQVRFIDYQFAGPDRSGVITDRKENFVFFNPKAGVSRVIGDKGLCYFSVARSNREPVRKDFINSTPESLPKPEQLTDFETGYRISTGKYSLNANLYYMLYKDQLVLTGQVNDVGEATRQNVDKSYRRGIELDGTYRLLHDKLTLGGNLTISDNRIVAFTEEVVSFDEDGIPGVYHWENTPIALSPSLITALYAQYEVVRNLQVLLQAKFVSRQYVDNSGAEVRSLDPFMVFDLRVDYRRDFKRGIGMEIGLLVNNLLGDVYVADGYTYPYIYGGERITDNYLYPQAPMNFLLRTAVIF